MSRSPIPASARPKDVEPKSITQLPMTDGGAGGDLVAATSALLADLHRVVEALELLHPGRKFTADGHLVGSLGEVAAVAMFDLTSHNASNKGCDAIAADGRTVDIKATYATKGAGVCAEMSDVVRPPMARRPIVMGRDPLSHACKRIKCGRRSDRQFWVGFGRSWSAVVLGCLPHR